MSEIEKKIKEIIIDKLAIEDSVLDLNSHFIDDLGADSLDVVELVMTFEEEFDIPIEDDVAGDMATVQDAIDYIAENT
jgi:acyl carrier protein